LNIAKKIEASKKLVSDKENIPKATASRFLEYVNKDLRKE